MTTAQIATRLVEMLRAGDYAGAQTELYADDAQSIEPAWAPHPRQQGREALQKKLAAWSETFNTHSNTISDPVIAGNFFSLASAVDVTEKKTGHRLQMSEIAVFAVRDGKIVTEQFFFDAP